MDQQYFVEGLSEEIISALTQIPELKVSARTSTFLLAEQGTDIATIARTSGSRQCSRRERKEVPRSLSTPVRHSWELIREQSPVS